METLFNFKNFGIILEKGEESWHGPTIGIALSAAAADLPPNEIESYLASIYRKFDTEVDIPFDFYGIKIAMCEYTQVFLTKAGHIILVSQVPDKLVTNIECHNGIAHDVNTVSRKYIFNRIQNHEFSDLSKKLKTYLPAVTYVEICKQMEIDYVEHLEWSPVT